MTFRFQKILVQKSEGKLKDHVGNCIKLTGIKTRLEIISLKTQSCYCIGLKQAILFIVMQSSIRGILKGFISNVCVKRRL